MFAWVFEIESLESSTPFVSYGVLDRPVEGGDEVARHGHHDWSEVRRIPLERAARRCLARKTHHHDKIAVANTGGRQRCGLEHWRH